MMAGCDLSDEDLADVRRYERERYLIGSLMPDAYQREAAILLAFNLEIAKTRESVREPLMGQIRLQWWRDAIAEIFEGRPVRHHAVVIPLAALIARRDLTRHHFDRMIDARERDLCEDPPPSLDALCDYAENTATRLLYLQLELTGTRNEAAFLAAKPVGIAYALAGLLRAWPFLIAERRPIMPTAWTPGDGLGELALTGPIASLWRDLVRRLVDHGTAQLTAARPLIAQVPRAIRPILLPAVAARAHFTRLAHHQYDPFDPGLQVPDGLMPTRLVVARILGRY